MRVWNSLDEVPTDLPRTVVTLGNFDGVHRGHREVLRRVVELARARDALAVAVTFTPHPRAVHHPEVPHVDIISPEQRVVLLEEAGLDAVLLQRYTLEFADQSPEEFVRGMLVHGLHAAVVVVGHDVRVGRGHTGDVAEMVRLGAHYGFEVEAVEEFPAEHGAEHGRELGFPTANLETDVQGMIPADGVYAGWVHDAHGGVWPAAISIGSNPTFEDVSRVVEAHVIDRHDERVEDFDLYGQHIEVEFVARLRGMVAYEGVEKLVAQITQDVDEARAILATTPSDR